MSDLFISYSRKDKEFVHKLHDALAAQKRDVWVDFEDIPLASEWRDEIFTLASGEPAAIKSRKTVSASVLRPFLCSSSA